MVRSPHATTSSEVSRRAPNSDEYRNLLTPDGAEVSLIAVLGVLKRHARLILALSLCGTAAVAGYAFLATPVYRARAVIAPPDQTRTSVTSAAVAALGGLGTQIAGNLGISLGGADANRLLALLSSHRLLERIVQKHDLLPTLFSEQWDAANEKWKSQGAVRAPDTWDAERLLSDRLFRVESDVRLGVLRLSVDYRDPETAERILKYYLDELASLMQEDEIRKIQRNTAFVQEQLQVATDPSIVAKLQSLLSEQIENALMAQNLEHFAYEVIDPPAASNVKIRPKRLVLTATGLTLSTALGVLAAFVLEWFKKVHHHASSS